jgi:hypothetical protein
MIVRYNFKSGEGGLSDSTANLSNSEFKSPVEIPMDEV